MVKKPPYFTEMNSETRSTQSSREPHTLLDFLLSYEVISNSGISENSLLLEEGDFTT